MLNSDVRPQAPLTCLCPCHPLTGLQAKLVWGHHERVDSTELCPVPSDLSPGAPSWLLSAKLSGQRESVRPWPWALCPP